MSLRILFVEDHQDTLRTMSNLLRHFGHQVHPAQNCESATSLMETLEFDVLLSDIGLPDGEGYELARKASEAHPSSRRIALTAFNSSEDVERGLDAGFNHYLSKPCDLAELKKLLAETAI